MSRYDIAVIGTGPAGLEAAVTAKIRNKTVLLIGSRELSPKIHKAERIKNFLGIPDVSGADLAQAFRRHLEQEEIEITEERVSAVYAMGDFFAIQTGGEMYEASTLILATGVVAGKPLPGEEELLGNGVSYCATCDAPLYKGRKVAVIGYSAKEEAEAAFLSEVCSEVLYFPMYKGEISLPENVTVLNEKPVGISRAEDNSKLVSCGDSSYSADCVFVLRDSIAPGQLVPGLATDDRHVTVNAKMETNIPGCFACGDLVGTPYQYIKAAGEGNIAALSAVSFLAARK